MLKIMGYSAQALEQAAEAASKGSFSTTRHEIAIVEGLLIKIGADIYCAPVVENANDLARWSEAIKVLQTIGIKMASSKAEPKSEDKKEVVYKEVPRAEPDPELDFMVPKDLEPLRPLLVVLKKSSMDDAHLMRIVSLGADSIKLGNSKDFIAITTGFWGNALKENLDLAGAFPVYESEIRPVAFGSSDRTVQRVLDDIMDRTGESFRKFVQERLANWIDKGYEKAIVDAWAEAGDRAPNFPVKFFCSLMDTHQRVKEMEEAKEQTKLSPEQVHQIIGDLFPKNICNWKKRLDVIERNALRAGYVDVIKFFQYAYAFGGVYPELTTIEDHEARKDAFHNEFEFFGLSSNNPMEELTQAYMGSLGSFLESVRSHYVETNRIQARTNAELQEWLGSLIKNWLLWLRSAPLKIANATPTGITQLVTTGAFLNTLEFAKDIFKWWREEYGEPLSDEVWNEHFS